MSYEVHFDLVKYMLISRIKPWSIPANTFEHLRPNNNYYVSPASKFSNSECCSQNVFMYFA
jgi:hypothetical protein